jgi:hypothetical protein
VTRLLLKRFILLLFPYFSGPVVSLLDGDTIEVLHNTAPNASA